MTSTERGKHHLAESDDRFRLLVESVQDYAIFMLDKEGYVATWNAGAERIKGYSPEEIVGEHLSRFYTPEDLAAQKPQREIEIATANGRVADEGWRVRKDGSRFWAMVVLTAIRDRNGELQGFAKVTRDLTERKEAEEKLRASEEQFRLLVSGVEEYAIFMLDPRGRVASWNVGAHNIKGYSADEIIGKSFENFYTAEDRANGKPAWLLDIARREGHVREQGLRVRKDGTTFAADVLITAIRDASGAILGFSKVTRDMTEQLRNRSNEAARIAAEKASKAKDEFLAVLSHELRTPLTPALAAASYIAEHEKLPPELADEVMTIRRNVQLEARLIDDLLDLTRITTGKIELHAEAVDLHDVVNKAIDIVREDVTEKQLEIALELGAPEHHVWADPVRLQQVFWNLLNNAVKFTAPRGRIVVRSNNDEAGRCAIEVADTGIGIEPAQQERLFKAFEQGERAITRQFGGLGLGLTISKRLIDLHGGTITGQSAGKGRGATFKVALQLADPVQAASGARSGERPHLTKSLRLLVVDDHADTRRTLSRLLTRAGHRVESADAVQSALDLLQTNQFDVLISDIGLPERSGYDLVRQAKQQQQMKSIALSGFGMEEDVRRSLEAGFDHHLTKPIEFDTLQSVLRDLAV
jgi:PAS domain S-box-containing protein